MSSRLPSRLYLLSRVFRHLFSRRIPPQNPQKILVAHHLLLGDTLMLTPLLAKLRQQYPDSEISLCTPKALTNLYSRAPYGVKAIPYDPRDLTTLRQLCLSGPFDLALIPGDNRYSWSAFAAGSRWIIAFDGDRPGYKTWLVDQLMEYPSIPAAWFDMNTLLIEGPPPPPYKKTDWPAPDFTAFDHPGNRYAVLHIGASSSLKLWPTSSWTTVCEYLSNRGFEVIWSAGISETGLINEIDPENRYRSFAGKLDLCQMWSLINNADLLISPDTGIAHIGRLVMTPTIVLFGPGSKQLYGDGQFWQDAPYECLSESIDCRDQPFLFKREIPWVHRCARKPDECPFDQRCMKAIKPDHVIQKIEALLHEKLAP